MFLRKTPFAVCAAILLANNGFCLADDTNPGLVQICPFWGSNADGVGSLFRSTTFQVVHALAEKDSQPPCEPGPNPSAEDRAAESLRKRGATIERDHDGQVYWVHLEKCRVTDDDLARLAPLKSLRVLNLCGTDVEGRGVEHLKGLTNLELLHLQDAVLTLVFGVVATLVGLDTYTIRFSRHST